MTDALIAESDLYKTSSCNCHMSVENVTCGYCGRRVPAEANRAALALDRVTFTSGPYKRTFMERVEALPTFVLLPAFLILVIGIVSLCVVFYVRHEMAPGVQEREACEQTIRDAAAEAGDFPNTSICEK